MPSEHNSRGETLSKILQTLSLHNTLKDLLSSLSTAQRIPSKAVNSSYQATITHPYVIKLYFKAIVEETSKSLIVCFFLQTFAGFVNFGFPN